MDRQNLMDCLAELGVEVIKPSTENVSVSCVFAEWDHIGRTDKHPSMSIKIDDEGPSLYRCFTCQKAGTFLGLLYELRGKGKEISEDLFKRVKKLEKQEAAEVLERAIAHRTMMFDTWAREGVFKPEVNTWDEVELSRFQDIQGDYLIRRGISEDVCRKWELRYDPDEKRIIYPVRGQNHELLGVVGRATDDITHPKYRNYLMFNKAKVLFGEVFFNSETNRIILVEGPMDVIRVSSYGYDNVVGSLGASLSKEQADVISTWNKTVYLFYDWDKAGWQGRDRAIDLLKGKVPLVNVVQPVSAQGIKDPDQCSKEIIEQALKEAQFIF